MKKSLFFLINFIFLLQFLYLPCFAEENTISEQIVLSADDIQYAENQRYGGFGLLISGSDGEILHNFKKTNSDEYNKLLNVLFGGDNPCIKIIRTEIGCGINHGNGVCLSENSEDYAFEFISDAKKLNSSLKVGIVRWGDPYYVTREFELSTSNGYKARFEWLYNYIQSVSEKYNISIDYISSDAEEANCIDTQWIKYLYRKLNENKLDIKIISSDEYDSWDIANEIYNDVELSNFIDVISVHGSTNGTAKAKIVKDDTDICFYSGEFSPDNSNFFFFKPLKDVMSMYIDGGFSIVEFADIFSLTDNGVNYNLFSHVFSFLNEGYYIDEKASKSGEYIAFVNQETGDYTLIFCNSSPYDIEYELVAKDLGVYDKKLYLWKSDNSAYFNSYEECDVNFQGRYRVTDFIVKSGEVATLTTQSTQKNQTEISTLTNVEECYFYCQGGNFENDNEIIIQKAISTEKPDDCSFYHTPSPMLVYNIGNEENCSISVDATLCSGVKNYVGIGLGINDNNTERSGYSIIMEIGGKVCVYLDGKQIATHQIKPFVLSDKYNLRLEKDENMITAYLNDEIIYKNIYYGEEYCRVGIYSAYYENQFSNVTVEHSGKIFEPVNNQMYSFALTDNPNLATEEEVEENLKQDEEKIKVEEQNEQEELNAEKSNSSNKNNIIRNIVITVSLVVIVCSVFVLIKYKKDKNSNA